MSVALLSSCGSSTNTGPTHIDAFQQAPGASKRCPAIMAALPTTLKQQPRTPTTGSPFGAAWGKPAIVVRCGVVEPQGANAYASCLTVNDIDWFLSGATPDMNDSNPNKTITVTTMYRSPAIQVTVPNAYGTQGPSTAMAQLTAVVKAHTTVHNHCQ